MSETMTPPAAPAQATPVQQQSRPAPRPEPIDDDELDVPDFLK